MDLSKAFDALNHNLLLAKLNVNVLPFNVIKLVKISLSERFQGVNINNNFTTDKITRNLNIFVD